MKKILILVLVLSSMPLFADTITVGCLNDLASNPNFSILQSKVLIADDGIAPPLDILNNNQKPNSAEKAALIKWDKFRKECYAAGNEHRSSYPPQVLTTFRNLFNDQDRLLGDLYLGKITYGQYAKRRNDIVEKYKGIFANNSVNGYFKSDETYIDSHFRTTPNSTNSHNPFKDNRPTKNGYPIDSETIEESQARIKRESEVLTNQYKQEQNEKMEKWKAQRLESAQIKSNESSNNHQDKSQQETQKIVQQTSQQSYQTAQPQGPGNIITSFKQPDGMIAYLYDGMCPFSSLISRFPLVFEILKEGTTDSVAKGCYAVVEATKQVIFAGDNGKTTTVGIAEIQNSNKGFWERLNDGLNKMNKDLQQQRANMSQITLLPPAVTQGNQMQRIELVKPFQPPPMIPQSPTTNCTSTLSGNQVLTHCQ
jgi:hypothetical protein